MDTSAHVLTRRRGGLGGEKGQLSFQLRNKQSEGGKHTKLRLGSALRERAHFAKSAHARARFVTLLLLLLSLLFFSFTAVRTPHGLCYGGAYPRIGSSAEVLGLPSAMRPLPIINGKEERREKPGGGG